MSTTDENGNRTYTTTDRKLIIKEQMVDRLFKGIDALFEIAKTSENPYGDPRIDFTTNLMTLFVMDNSKSKELRESRKKRVMEETKGITDKKAANIIIGEIDLDILSECFELFDNFIGFKKRQVILEIKDRETVKYANELNNTYIERMMACQGDTIDTSGVLDPTECNNGNDDTGDKDSPAESSEDAEEDESSTY